MNTENKWRKSSTSVANGSCVELAYDGAVRDSKNPTGPVLAVDVSAFVDAVKSLASR
ncbi:DUF397 domain-containing protein [Actinophytocola xanthii]|uniref:DUF397 domain-containing protein n=1 Tax=Actinophytocola xanthii TaxID=1912961 RepID=A0A1Q8CXH5_9PSEU|nr:DUF397 domain-containing protein [Actinophytocola xanthii]OLF19041.1 hypothetical protein BU204_04115 [Actinophytocola xanthii]